MKKKGSVVLTAFFAVLCVTLSFFAPVRCAVASEENSEEEQMQETETETETETQLPDSYFLPIESNEVKGWPQGPQVEAEAAVVMDVSSGTFLYSKNMTAKEYPASITKIMTALVAIENGNLDKKIKCSEHAVYSIEAESSHCGLQPGEKLTLRQALYALMLESANDAANSIAERVGGTIEAFVQMMNDKAKELGCVNTHFTNPHGLHDEDHYTCAYDMALITRAAFANETLAEIAGTVEYSIPKTNKVKEVRYFLNHHKMLSSEEYLYEGCIGGKTGFTSDALNTLVTVAQRDGRRLISVVLKTNGATKTYEESTALLDYGYDQFVCETMQIQDAQLTRAALINMDFQGRTALLEPDVLREPVVTTAKSTEISIPKDGKKKAVKVTYLSDGTLQYTYRGWNVGSASIQFQKPGASLSVSTVSQKITESVPSEKLLQTEAEPEEAKGDWLEKARTAWSGAMEWIYDHDIMAAIVVFILILALLPILMIAYVRNRSSQMIRKERRREREARIRREEEIDSKSVQEIEAEIRGELEKERLKREREEARRLEAQKEEQTIAEAEEVIEKYQKAHRSEETAVQQEKSKGEESV